MTKNKLKQFRRGRVWRGRVWRGWLRRVCSKILETRGNSRNWFVWWWEKSLTIYATTILLEERIMKTLLKKSWNKSGLVSNAQKIYLTLIQFNNLIEKGTQIKILSTNVCMLDVSYTKFNFTGIVELGSMSRMKVLNFRGILNSAEIDHLKIFFPKPQH